MPARDMRSETDQAAGVIPACIVVANAPQPQSRLVAKNRSAFMSSCLTDEHLGLLNNRAAGWRPVALAGFYKKAVAQACMVEPP